jgi:hypothetical protein
MIMIETGEKLIFRLWSVGIFRGGRMILRGTAIIAALLCLSACAVIDVNMGPYYVAPEPNCPVEVVDQRTDPGLIQGNATAYHISPSIKDLLRSKLCRNGLVVSHATADKKPAVAITELSISSFGFAGSDQMLTMSGSFRIGDTRRNIQSYGTVESGVLPSTRWPIILNSAMDNFVKQVEESLPGQN